MYLCPVHLIRESALADGEIRSVAAVAVHAAKQWAWRGEREEVR